ncbi:MAG: ATP-binding cassette domain-containing protein [Paracoccaceae bacterium]|nr:ATP-binding cassette domain-containing protein [Paracoccaceae bacterium]
MADTPAISVEDLWQVFGDNPSEAFERARAETSSPKEIAAALEARHLIPAVRGVSFDVAPGELFVIMGLSGSGKSTVIRGISRLVEPTSGTIRLDGEDIRAASKKRMTELRRSKIGMVFQHFGLFPHMSVIDNVAFPLKVGGMNRRARHEKVRPILDMVGLEGREDAFPRELSGGQRQRVGIARSLAGDCSIWFLDEPFSALDPLIRRQLQDEFLDIRKRLNTTIVFITHDITEALKLADRIAIMRDGHIVQIGTPADIVLNPVDDYVHDFARDVARGRHATVDTIMRDADGGAGPDDPGLRPDMTLEDALAACMRLYKPVPVRDADGDVLGLVHPQDLARALQAEKA